MVGEVLKGGMGVTGDKQSVLGSEQSQSGPSLPTGHFPSEAGEIDPNNICKDPYSK